MLIWLPLCIIGVSGRVRVGIIRGIVSVILLLQLNGTLNQICLGEEGTLKEKGEILGCTVISFDDLCDSTLVVVAFCFVQRIPAVIAVFTAGIAF